MTDKFKEVEIIDKEGKRTVFLEHSDGKYSDSDGRIYERQELEDSGNMVFPVLTPEEQLEQDIKSFRDREQPSWDQATGDEIPIDQPRKKYEFNKLNEDGSRTLISIKYQTTDLMGRSVTNHEEYLRASPERVVAYTATSNVNYPNPDNSIAVNKAEVRFGDVQLLECSKDGVYTGHANFVEVCTKSKFVEQCLSAGLDSKKLDFLGFGAKRNEDDSQTYSYGFGTTTLTKESIDEVREAENSVKKEFQKVKNSIEEKRQETNRIWDSLNTREGFEWFLENLHY